MPEDAHAAATVVAAGLFALVWLGLATNILKIAFRATHPPRFHPILGGANLGRFGGWALIGAAMLPLDPLTGALLVGTRIPGFALVLVTFLQRRAQRPGRSELLRWLGPPVGLLCAACAALAFWSPPAAVLQLLNGFVVLCFAVQALYALPAQILAARRRPLGNLRWFQLSMLANYAWMLLYSFFVREEGVQLIMRLAYGAVFVEQAILVALIEAGVRALRRRQREAKASRSGPSPSE